MLDIIYVDENDIPVGSGPIEDAVKNGVAVRVVRIFLMNDNSQLLLQKRSLSTIVSGGKWDQSAGGHVDAGEEYVKAAKRELSEEMGINGVKLTDVAKFYTEDQHIDGTRKRFNVIFSGTYNGKVKIDTKEVADYQWILLPELDDWISRTPNDFTQGFLTAYKLFKQDCSQPSS